MVGEAGGGEPPVSCWAARNTSSASAGFGALGRLAGALLVVPVAVPMLLVMIGLVVSLPPSRMRSRIVTWPEPSELLKLTVSVPDPDAPLAVVSWYDHW